MVKRGAECGYVYHWPATKVRSVEWIARHTLHECVHHLKDISR